ncbi:hypothetical protein FSW04_05415 [Baekduia soli]|uniref:DUF8091 domain-containing protein n=1 Tax=Baekduia soli TaxID=496014 RepID=A0A5B8U2B0_9ACTN|nr:hypothetical protein [Baekduia soli]QEC47080.1 hypothetical protein FSW04_05415 [Baekduia soli]
MTGIGVLREGPLHAAVKDLYARPGDRAEVPLAGFVIDLVRADGELVEIQTGGFGPLGAKLDALLDGHRMRIVHPVAAERRIVRVDEHGEVLSARRSPRRGDVLDVFDRLVSFPSLLAHPNLAIDVLLCREDHVRAPEARRSRSGRRRRDPGQRRLVEVMGCVELAGPADVAALLPAGLGAGAGTFTTRELATALGCRVMLAQRIVYCLRAMELLADAGRRGRAPLHARAVAA